MDTRRLILAFIFGFSLIMLWDAWEKHKTIQNPSSQAIQGNGGQSQRAVGTAQHAVPNPSVDLQAKNTVDGGVPDKSIEQTAQRPSQTVRVSTDLYHADISLTGGDIVRLELLKHRAHDKEKGGNLVLLNNQHQYAVQSGLIGKGLPNHKLQFTARPGVKSLPEGSNSLDLVLEATGDTGVKLVKTLSFTRNSYSISQNLHVVNETSSDLNAYAYFQIKRNKTAPYGDNFMLSTFTGPAVYTEAEKYQKVDFEDIVDNDAQYAKIADNGWVAMVQHHFVSALLPKGDVQREFYMNKLDTAGNLFVAGVIVPTGNIPSGGYAEVAVPLYVGPQEQARLKPLAAGLDLVVDYGWLTIVAAPIFWLLSTFYTFAGNWGWAIVLLTMLIKLIFYPLSAASYKSMAKMKLVAPRLVKLKERYPDDKQKLNQEMMKLYQTEKINPLGGCLPILVQIPVFIALYWALLGAVEIRGAPWVLHIKDLSVPDPYYILPVIMMLSMFFQIRMNPKPPDPTQAKIMIAMPIVFGVTFFFFPAGLVLYWVVNNILSIAQQWHITRKIEGGSKN